jgi:hypothetical protein
MPRIMKSHSSTEVARNATTPARRSQRPAAVVSLADYEHRRSDELVHRGLATRNLSRVRPGMVVDADDVAEMTAALRELAAVQYVEQKFVGEARVTVASHATEAPSDADGLIAWLEGLRLSGPGQLDPLVHWLAESASEEQLRWYVQQELATEIGIPELKAAVANLGLQPSKVSYLTDLAALIGVELPATTDVLSWESLARANLIIALASNRRWAGQAIGAMIAIMMTSPQRLATVERGLTRLGYEVYPPAPAYDPSVTAALVHKAVASGAANARDIAEGALMWMHFRVRCQSRYRVQLLDG